jgi:hypothetical protein
MLVRIRWFLLGVAATLGGGAWLLGRAARLRQRLTPASIARTSGHAVADLIDDLAATVGGRPS